MDEGGQAEKLRDELIEFQKAMADLQKWKLIGLGAIFAAGLGFAEKSTGYSTEPTPLLALFAVPMVCAYADLLICDYDVRLGLIARFMHSDCGLFSKYEAFLGTTTKRRFVLGHAAKFASSYLANASVLAILGFTEVVGWVPAYVRSILWWGAVGGLIITSLVLIFYWLLVRTIWSKEISASGP
jgi:hypothetical protein